MTGKFTFIYCRISADQQGRAEGVQAQEKWGRQYAAQHWPGTPVRIYSDNDLSAAKEDVRRPEFEKMREAIRRGECANLWAVEQSRLTRIKLVWFELASELVASGVSEVHTRRNGVVPVDSVVSDILAILDANEVKKLRQRLLDKKGDLVSQGRPIGALGYGYRQVILTPEEEKRLRKWQARRHEAQVRGEDMREWKAANPRPAGGKPVLDEQGRRSALVVEHEAEVIRECAKRLLNGWGVKALATWLNSQGLKGKHGGRFVATSVSDFLTAPSVAGFAVHRGEIVGRGTWEPILDEATWRSVCAVIGSRKKSRHRSRRVYLLTGYRMLCTCGKPMQARPSGDYAYYACEPSVTDGCGLTTIDAHAAEDDVAVRLFEHMEELNAAGMLSGDLYAERRAELAKEMEAVAARRGELAEMWQAKAITTDQFGIMNNGLREEHEALEAELARLPIPAAHADPDDLRAAWPEMPLDEKRKFVDDWIERITVKPRDPGPRRFKAVTQQDVADRARVSLAFANYVIRGQIEGRSPERVRRVQEAISELGYEPGRSTYRRPTTYTDGISIDWRR